MNQTQAKQARNLLIQLSNEDLTNLKLQIEIEQGLRSSRGVTL